MIPTSSDIRASPSKSKISKVTGNDVLSLEYLVKGKLFLLPKEILHKVNRPGLLLSNDQRTIINVDLN